MGGIMEVALTPGRLAIGRIGFKVRGQRPLPLVPVGQQFRLVVEQLLARFGGVFEVRTLDDRIDRAGALELGTPDGSAAPLLGESNIENIGSLLYGRSLFLFETAGIILLVAMIGAIVLTHRERKDTRPQNISKQIARKPSEATVNMRPEVGQGVEL